MTVRGAVIDALVMSEWPTGSSIPEEFWSAFTEQPFQVCIDCETSLTDGQVPYAIQKHFVAGEAVFEMAMCLQCAARLQAGFSQESRTALQHEIHVAPERLRRQGEAEDESLEFTSGEDLSAQLEQITRLQGLRRERAMACCVMCAKLRTDCHRYSLGTACLGASLLNASPQTDNLGSPFLICDDCEQQLNECISLQTRDAWDRFVEEMFDGPPALAVDPRELVAMF